MSKYSRFPCPSSVRKSGRLERGVEWGKERAKAGKERRGGTEQKPRTGRGNGLSRVRKPRRAPRNRGDVEPKKHREVLLN